MPENPIQEYPPSIDLREHVLCYWSGNFNAHALPELSQSVVPNGTVELIIHLTDDHCELHSDAWGRSPDYIVLGIYAEPYVVRFRRNVRVFGIRFNPDGFYTLLGVPPSKFLGGFEDLESVGGSMFKEFCNRIRDCRQMDARIHVANDFLRKHHNWHLPVHNYVHTAARLIRQNWSLKMAELHDLIAISPRQLQREFKNQLGITPKTYMRLARMSAAHQYLRAEGKVDLTTIAHASGFSDQAHFIREFHALTGSRPGAFLQERDKYLVPSA
ncbi:MAG TPA: helix-turn-helix domain-containing protein [Cyclobacteriaceae bacterium]|jgi:AraC-like DNA-binding protein